MLFMNLHIILSIFIYRLVHLPFHEIPTGLVFAGKLGVIIGRKKETLLVARLVLVNLLFI